MSSKRTLSGALGLVFLAAALWSGSAMAAGPTPAAIRADGLRWQAMADFYEQLQSPTPAGIKADGLRWQAIARFYEQQQRPTPAAIRADGLRWQAIARASGVQAGKAAPATVDDGTVVLAGPRYTPQELKALIAYSKASFAEKKALLAGTEPSTTGAGNNFHWNDAGIGAGVALGCLLIAGVGAAPLVRSRGARRGLRHT